MIVHMTPRLEGSSMMELIVTPLRQMALTLVHGNVLGASMMRVFVQRFAWHQVLGASMRALLQQKVLPSDHRSSASSHLRCAASTRADPRRYAMPAIADEPSTQHAASTQVMTLNQKGVTLNQKGVRMDDMMLVSMMAVTTKVIG